MLASPGELGTVALSPYHEAKAFPTLLCPTDDSDRGDKAVQGVGAESPVTDREEEPGQGSGSTQAGKPR